MERWVCPKDTDKARNVYPRFVVVYNSRYNRYEAIWYFVGEEEIEHGRI